MPGALSAPGFLFLRDALLIAGLKLRSGQKSGFACRAGRLGRSKLRPCKIVRRLRFQVDGFARGGGLAGGIEDFGHDDVCVESAQAGRVQIVEDYCAEIVDRVIFGRGDGLGVQQIFLLLAGKAHADVVALHGDGVTGLAVHFHIFAIERPIPRGLQDRDGLRIGDEDGAFVVDLICVGLKVLCDGGDGVGAAAIHQPGHEICAIAAEIVECARAIQLGVVEPREEFRLDVDFCGARVAVVNDNFANLADFVFVDEIVGGAIAAIPRGFVIDEDGNVGGFCRALDGVSVVDADGERLFHHDGDFVFGADFDGADVIVRVGVDEDGLRLRGGEQFVKIGVVHLGVEIKFCGVAIEDGFVGLGDADEFDVVAIFDVREEAVGVSVSEAGHGNSESGSGLRLSGRGDCGEEGEREDKNRCANHRGLLKAW